MEDESTIKTTAAMLYARGGAGRKASNGSGVKASKGSGGSGGSVACGGTLEDCVAACPSEVPTVFTVCVATCGKRCGEK